MVVMCAFGLSTVRMIYSCFSYGVCVCVCVCVCVYVYVCVCVCVCVVDVWMMCTGHLGNRHPWADGSVCGDH